MLRSTIPPRHSRVCSSMIDTILIGRPSVVTSNWKSTAHTRWAHRRPPERRGGTAVALSSSPLRNPQPFFPPKPLDLLVIDDPALSASVVVGGPEPPAGMILSVVTQPVSQRGVGVLRCRRGGFVALSGAVLPGHAAGEPLADPQHALEVTNGRPPAFRA